MNKFIQLKMSLNNICDELIENYNKLKIDEQSIVLQQELIKDQHSEIESFKKVSVVTSLNKQLTQNQNEISILKKQLALSEARNLKLQDTINIHNKKDIEIDNIIEADVNVPETNNTKVAETNAEVAETNAEVAETNAEVAETNAEVAETNAEVAETNAEVAETNTEVAETNAEVAETNTEVAETNNTEGSETSNIEVEKPIIFKYTDVVKESDDNTRQYKEIKYNKKYYYVYDTEVFKKLKHGKVGKKSIGSLVDNVINIA